MAVTETKAKQAKIFEELNDLQQKVTEALENYTTQVIKPFAYNCYSLGKSLAECKLEFVRSNIDFLDIEGLTIDFVCNEIANHYSIFERDAYFSDYDE